MIRVINIYGWHSGGDLGVNWHPFLVPPFSMRLLVAAASASASELQRKALHLPVLLISLLSRSDGNLKASPTP